MLQFLLKRKLIVGLFIVLVIGTGMYSVKKMDRELFPDVNFNQVFVHIQTEEMPSTDVEQFVTIPLERKLETMEGIKQYDSTTTAHGSTFVITTEKEDAELTKDIENEVGLLKGDFQKINETAVFQASTNGPDFFLDLSGASMNEMEKFAEDILKPRLEALSEVKQVQIDGLKQQEVQIILKPEKLVEFGLSKDEIVATVNQTNQSLTIGSFQGEENHPTLHWNTTFDSVADIGNAEIPTDQGLIHLAEVAEIELADSAESSYAWKNGDTNFLLIQIERSEGYSQIDMTNKVRNEIASIERETDSTVKIHEIAAKSDYVENALDGIISNIIIGGIIAIIVLLVFLRNLRATMIIGLSIPTSILLTIIAMTMLDYSFNIISLIGLGLGIGMMVDASIVVLESINQKKEQGLPYKKAVIQGTKEVFGAIISSALTTIVVFVPIVLLDDDVGKMMLILTIVIAITLISSVLVAFTLIPVLSERFMRVKTQRDSRSIVKNTYESLLKWLTGKKRRRYGIIALFTIVFFSSLLLFAKIPTTFMPDILNRYAEIAIELEPGVSMETKQKIAADINKELRGIPDIESNIVMDNLEFLFAIINMTPEEEKTLEQTEINERIFKQLNQLKRKYPIRSIGSALEGAGSPSVEIQVTGENLTKLQNIGRELNQKIKDINGVTTTKLHIGEQKKQFIVQPNKNALENNQLSEAYLFNEISGLFNDQPLGTAILDGNEMPMIIKNDLSIPSRRTLLQQQFMTKDGEKPLSQFVSLKETNVPYQINHSNGSRYVAISAEYTGKDLASLNKDIERVLKQLNVEDGYTAKIAGELEAQQQAAFDLMVIFMASLFLVFIVMAIQFNSIKHPFIILMIIPLTITGVLVGMFITQKELNILSAIGLIMLIGIVINNGILLIDRVRQFREQGIAASDAMVQAGTERIRPIFMTTLTTVGGMLPLAMASGTSSDYQSPLAVVLISGLLFSTMITLVLIPAIYLTFEDIEKGARRIFRGRSMTSVKGSEDAAIRHTS